MGHLYHALQTWGQYRRWGGKNVRCRGWRIMPQDDFFWTWEDQWSDKLIADMVTYERVNKIKFINNGLIRLSWGLPLSAGLLKDNGCWESTHFL